MVSSELLLAIVLFSFINFMFLEIITYKSILIDCCLKTVIYNVVFLFY